MSRVNAREWARETTRRQAACRRCVGLSNYLKLLIQRDHARATRERGASRGPLLLRAGLDRHAGVSPVRAAAGVFVAIVLALMSGCGDGLGTSYGPSSGYLAKQSINGFTTFRRSFDKAGFTTRDLNRLTDRARRSAVIVWTPTHPAGIENRTTSWMERWLRQGNRTLIYVLPDSGSEALFYRDARPLASPQQRLEYRRKYAEALIEEHRWQLQRNALQSNGWFFVGPKVQRTAVVLADSDAAKDGNWKESSEFDEPQRFEWVIEAYDRENPPQQGAPIWQPAGPGSMPWQFGQTVSPGSTEVDFQPILQSTDGDTLVAQITSDQWRGSQILVVAGGSLLTNYGLTLPSNQQLAGSLIDQSLATVNPSNRAAAKPDELSDEFKPTASFATASYSLPISERAGEIPRAAGAEFFTEFPLSFVTLHIAILGFVICLMLMPIFGRPRRIDRGVLTNFGDHINAVATLMRRRGGQAYARQRISDYMKQVRDETSGPWVIVDPHPAASAAIHMHVPGATSSGEIAATPDHSETPVPESSLRRPDDSDQPDRG